MTLVGDFRKAVGCGQCNELEEFNVLKLTTMAAPQEVAFISGPIAPPPEYFATHYEPLLLAAIASGNSFVVGPAPGIDSIALEFLISQGLSPSKITVYLAEFQNMVIRPGLKWFEDLGGLIKVEGVTTSERDAAMTRDSDYDVLRYMTIEEQKVEYGKNYYPRVSATQKNELRRMGLSPPAVVGDLQEPARAVAVQKRTSGCMERLFRLIHKRRLY